VHEATVERKTFNKKKPPYELEPGRAAICLDWLGVERTGKRGQQAPGDSSLQTFNKLYVVAC